MKHKRAQSHANGDAGGEEPRRIPISSYCTGIHDRVVRVAWNAVTRGRTSSGRISGSVMIDAEALGSPIMDQTLLLWAHSVAARPAASPRH
jgi:hypothetical protein